MCCSLVEITFHAHYNPQRDMLSPHSVQQEIEFQRDSVNRPGHTAQGNGIRITRKPTIVALMSTFKKKSHFYFQEILSNRKHKCLRKKQGRRGQSVEKRFAWTSGRRKSSEGDAVGFSVGVRFKMLNKQGSRVRNQGCQ